MALRDGRYLPPTSILYHLGHLWPRHKDAGPEASHALHRRVAPARVELEPLLQQQSQSPSVDDLPTENVQSRIEVSHYCEYWRNCLGRKLDH